MNESQPDYQLPARNVSHHGNSGRACRLEYQPLSREARETRLLTLLPPVGDEYADDTIRLEMRHVPWNDDLRSNSDGDGDADDDKEPDDDDDDDRDGTDDRDHDKYHDRSDNDADTNRGELDKGTSGHNNEELHDDVSAARPIGWGRYVAVSYEWGSPKHKRMIFLNSWPFLVTSNLFEVLSSLRQALAAKAIKCDYPLWIDAICINQQDLDERQQQVPRMKEIYSTARRVYCFLTIGERFKNSRQNPKAHMRRVEATSLLFEYLDVLFNHAAKGDFTHWSTSRQSIDWVQPRHALKSFFANSYWTRLWIIQEVALSRLRTKVFYLNAVLPGIAVVASLEHLRTWADAHDCTIYILATQRRLVRHDMTFILGAGMHVLGVLAAQLVHLTGDNWVSATNLTSCARLAQSGHASVPHDKVYALMGLMDDAIARRIIVDYKGPALAPSIALCGAVAEYFQTLEGLPRTAIADATTSSSSGVNTWPSLPSWSHDFSHGHSPADGNYGRAVSSEHPGSPGAAKVLVPTFRIQHVQSRLHVYGLELDRIRALTPVFLRDDDFDSDTRSRPDTTLASLRGGGTASQTTGIADMPDLIASFVQILLQSMTAEDHTSGAADPTHLLASRALLESRIRHGKDRLRALLIQYWYDLCDEFLLDDGRPLLGILDAYPRVVDTMDAEAFTRMANGIIDSLESRRIAYTTAGRLALLGPSAERGDVLCALCGLEPVGVLRAQPGGEWRWIGQCFAPGLMNGEGVVGREGQVREFILI